MRPSRNLPNERHGLHLEHLKSLGRWLTRGRIARSCLGIAFLIFAPDLPETNNLPFSRREQRLSSSREMARSCRERAVAKF